MDIREKVAGLLNEAGDNVFIVSNQPVAPQRKRIWGEIADYLVANGVTVQEWVPVTERLPEEDDLVLCIGARGGMFLGTRPWLYGDETSAYFSVPNSRRSRYATHWMPLPQPPKGD